VTARVEDAVVPTAESILQQYREVDPRSRGQLYRAGGWDRFDENAPAYTEAELEEERRLGAPPAF
jgi:hypothetical protein